MSEEHNKTSRLTALPNVTRQRGFSLIELMIAISIIGILVAIAIPQYQLHVARAQAGRIIGELGELRLSVEDCLNEGLNTIGTGAQQCDPRVVASNLIAGASQVGVVLPNDTGVAQITNPLTLTASITATLSNQVNPALKGKKIVWQRTVAGSWTCQSNIYAQYLPNSCTYDSSIN